MFAQGYVLKPVFINYHSVSRSGFQASLLCMEDFLKSVDDEKRRYFILFFQCFFAPDLRKSFITCNWEQNNREEEEFP